jgi:hypothetical protein
MGQKMSNIDTMTDHNTLNNRSKDRRPEGIACNTVVDSRKQKMNDFDDWQPNSELRHGLQLLHRCRAARFVNAVNAGVIICSMSRMIIRGLCIKIYCFWQRSMT